MGTVCGIDVGKNGGLAFLDETTQAVVALVVMPKDIFHVRDLMRQYDPKRIMIEKGAAFTGNTAESKAHMFSYGKHCGALEGLFLGLGIPFDLVHPQVWQRAVIGPRNPMMLPKERALQAARLLAPDQSFIPTRRHKGPHDGVVDAYLIARYGILSLKGLV